MGASARLFVRNERIWSGSTKLYLLLTALPQGTSRTSPSSQQYEQNRIKKKKKTTKSERRNYRPAAGISSDITYTVGRVWRVWRLLGLWQSFLWYARWKLHTHPICSMHLSVQISVTTFVGCPKAIKLYAPPCRNLSLSLTDRYQIFYHEYGEYYIKIVVCGTVRIGGRSLWYRINWL